MEASKALGICTKVDLLKYHHFHGVTENVEHKEKLGQEIGEMRSTVDKQGGDATTS